MPERFYKTGCSFFITIIVLISTCHLSFGEFINNKFGESDKYIPGYYAVYCDSTCSLNIEDVISKNKEFFVVPIGERTSKKGLRYFLKFALTNTSGKQIILEAPHEYKNIKLYEVKDENITLLSSAGLEVPFSDKPFYSTKNILPLSYTDKTQFLILQMDAQENIGLGLGIHNLIFFNRISATAIIQIGFFLGLYFIILIYNLNLYIQSKEKVYFHYSLYLIALIIYGVVSWGIADPFLFKKMDYDFIVLTIPFSLITCSLMLYCQSFFDTKKNFPLWHKVINFLIFLRLLILFIGFIADIDYLHDPGIDNLLLLGPFVVAINSIKNSFKPAIIFTVAFSSIYFGYLFHTFIYKSLILEIPYPNYLPYDNIFYYTSVVDIMIFSFALSSRYRTLIKEKQIADFDTIRLKEELLNKANEVNEIQQKLNTELNDLVKIRTAELEEANKSLKIQAQEIERMNGLLKADNEKLMIDIELISKARLMEKNAPFRDFTQIFTDELACLETISNLKWEKGFACKKCRSTNYRTGTLPFSRKCSVCNYQESVQKDTLLENVKFDLQKALYIIYIIYNNPEITASILSKELNLRNPTVTEFVKKLRNYFLKIPASKRNKTDWIHNLITR